MRLLHAGNRCAGQFIAAERPGIQPGVYCQGARRPSLPMHRVQADHRCDPNGSRSLGRSPRDAAERTSAPFLFRRGVWVEAESADPSQGKREERNRLTCFASRWQGTNAGRQAFCRRHARAGNATRRNGADCASEGQSAADRFFGSPGDAGSGESVYRGRRSGPSRPSMPGCLPTCRNFWKKPH